MDERGGRIVHLYFVWSETCPHCQAARPFVEGLPGRLPWLWLHSLPVSESGNAERAQELAGLLGQEITGVPTFLYCERMVVGFESAETTGADLVADLESCRAAGQTRGPSAPPPGGTVDVPILGEVDPQRVSLPVFTIVLAAVDAFNPCAFFVLLFLLSLLVHARSRARMAFVGGTFVLISALAYFLFMAAWLNLFRLAGQIRIVTVVAGVVAILIALLGVKDYVWFGRGPSLSIPQAAKPGLFRRMRSLTAATGLPALVMGTVTLAVAANSYELLCTAGFPMVYTRVLSLHELSTAGHLLYLGLYNFVYVIPLLAIVTVFVVTLGRHKLNEEQGRILKLLSGLMMLGLGWVLLLAPELLANVLTAVALLGSAAAVTTLVVVVDRGHRRPARA